MPDAVMRMPSMMSYGERTLLHWAARAGLRGPGTIVDAGCFLGGSTLPLGLGVLRREAEEGAQGKAARVHSFDLFQVGAERERVYFDDSFEFEIGASTIALYKRNIAPISDRVIIHAGDLNGLERWDEDISLLFVDIAKSWETNDTVVTRFFPLLVPDALIIQQDLVHAAHPWCALAMELLSDHFEYVGHVPFGSAVYRVVSPIPRSDVPTNLVELLTADDAVRLIERCAERVGPPYEGFVRLAAATAIMWYEQAERAREIIAGVAADYTDETLPWISEHVAMTLQFVNDVEAGNIAL